MTFVRLIVIKYFSRLTALSGTKSFEILVCPTDPISVFFFSGSGLKFVTLIIEEEISSQIITLKTLVINLDKKVFQIVVSLLH